MVLAILYMCTIATLGLTSKNDIKNTDISKKSTVFGEANMNYDYNTPYANYIQLLSSRHAIEEWERCVKTIGNDRY